MEHPKLKNNNQDLLQRTVSYNKALENCIKSCYDYMDSPDRLQEWNDIYPGKEIKLKKNIE